MPSGRKFYRTIVTVEILSEEPISQELDLDYINYLITDGDCSGQISYEQHQVDSKQIVDLLLKQGSDPEFFSLTEDGEDIETDSFGIGDRELTDEEHNLFIKLYENLKNLPLDQLEINDMVSIEILSEFTKVNISDSSDNRKLLLLAVQQRCNDYRNKYWDPETLQIARELTIRSLPENDSINIWRVK